MTRALLKLVSFMRIRKFLRRGSKQKRDFQFWRPSLDYRYNFADNFRFRGTIRRNVSQLSFLPSQPLRITMTGTLTALPVTRARAETSWAYNGELEYRLPNDAGVLATGLFYSDIDNKIGKIIATVDPNQPQSATGM